MREHWLMLVEQIQTLIDSDAIVINGLRNTPDVTKIKKQFHRNVRELSKLVEQFAMFVPNPERIEAELPFKSLEFAEAWRDYKEFLLGVYNIVLVEVEERRRLSKIFRLSGKDENTAIEMIDFLITSRYKSIFRPTDIQLKGETPEADTPQNEEENSFTIKKTTI